MQIQDLYGVHQPCCRATYRESVTRLFDCLHGSKSSQLGLQLLLLLVLLLLFLQKKRASCVTKLFPGCQHCIFESPFIRHNKQGGWYDSLQLAPPMPSCTQLQLI